MQITHTIRLDLKQLEGFKKGTADPVVVQSASQATEAIARRYAKRMSDLLQPGHKFGVGATGKSAKNLRVVQRAGGKGEVVWSVVEGGLTVGNEMIRSGRSKGSMPPPDAIEKWLLTKPNLLRSVEYRGRKARFTKYGGDRANRRTLKGRIFKADLKTLVPRAAYAIAQSMKGEGGNVGHISLFPVGRPYFDYPQYVMHDEYLARNPLAQDVSLSALSVIVEYLKTGKYLGTIGSRYYG